MVKPGQYEAHVADHFRRLGYKVTVTPSSGDYGIDVLAERGQERIAIQAKMYGGSARKVNRSAVMGLHGAMAYADCTSAVIVTDGGVYPDAEEVAEKLGISVLHLPLTEAESADELDPADTVTPPVSPTSSADTFESIWTQHVMPLAGRPIELMSGDKNLVVRVDWGGVLRITKNGKENHIPIEPFRFAVRRLLMYGSVTAREILEIDEGRYSRGVFAILAQVPIFEVEMSRPPVLVCRHGKRQ